MAQKAYFNFPVSVLGGFMANPPGTMGKMMKWAIYDYIKVSELREQTDLKGNRLRPTKQVTIALNALDLQFISVNKRDLYRECGEVYGRYKGARTGIKAATFMSYMDAVMVGAATDESKVCLLLFLACKAVLGNKDAVSTNRYKLCAYMNGETDTYHNEHEMQMYSDPVIFSYMAKGARRRFDRLRRELSEHWHMSFYTNRAMRGIWISSSMGESALAEYAEIRRGTAADSAARSKAIRAKALEKRKQRQGLLR